MAPRHTANGPVAPKKIQAEAKAAGLSWITVRRAKEALSIIHRKSSFGGGWEWRLEDARLEDAHLSEVGTFDAFDDDGEVRL